MERLCFVVALVCAGCTIEAKEDPEEASESDMASLGAASQMATAMEMALPVMARAMPSAGDSSAAPRSTPTPAAKPSARPAASSPPAPSSAAARPSVGTSKRRDPLPTPARAPNPLLLSELWFRWVSESCIELMSFNKGSGNDTDRFLLALHCKLAERRFGNQIFYAEFVADDRIATINPLSSPCLEHPSTQFEVAYLIMNVDEWIAVSSDPLTGSYTNTKYNDGTPPPLPMSGDDDISGCLEGDSFVPRETIFF
jgi:hypothetical protein